LVVWILILKIEFVENTRTE